MLVLPAAVVRVMQDHAFACYPAECCGLLFGDGNHHATRAVIVDNMADKLHALDPAEYPRTSRDAFAMNEAKVARLVREAEAAGERWLGIWHSHIDCGAYFSSEDKRVAAPGNVPVYPDLFQTVIDCRPGRIIEARTFRWDGTDYLPVATHGDFSRTR
jgi:[CysO sulfur-carrier protein]-S-L-cysteine hydrolase